MADEKTIAEEVAENAAETIDETDIDQAKDDVEGAEDIDADAVRDEIRDEDRDTRDETEEGLARVEAKLDDIIAKIDGMSRLFLDGGGVISDPEPADVEAAETPIDFDDMDFSID